MCGIFGLIPNPKKHHDVKQLKSLVDTLFRLSETRGKEAAGIAFIDDSTISVYKEPIRGSLFIKKKRYNDMWSRIPLGVLGHARLATNGPQTDNANNQPVVTRDAVGIHNGIVVNENIIWDILKKKPTIAVDTEVLLELIRHYLKHAYTLEDSVSRMFHIIEGSASIAAVFPDFPSIILATNTGSLYYTTPKNPACIIFASEKFILQELVSENGISQITAGNGRIIHLYNGTIKPFAFTTSPGAECVGKRKKLFQIQKYSSDETIGQRHASILNFSTSNNVRKLQTHTPDYKAIYVLRRCTRCILPETMPFIVFDQLGVCNYCRNHKKIVGQGKKALEELVAPYRSNDGKPDCIIAFSGGRDSSYGLHFLKKELGMNPIAYTYDWGMVTDLARRNEARMLGALGVEHVIVSADIRSKRDHIRKHIKAWMKKPNLGMVPLFMEGDKQAEYYANELSRKTGIKLIFYCRGNEYENEEFKWGHCGIRQATPLGVIHNLSRKGKLQIATYYAWQYLTNPAYINASLFDTLFAFFSTYIMTHDYIYLWHYIPWDEDIIIRTLKGKYEWETEKNTISTWRTDDGTASFYNYIYYVGQGFTENDTFRSNQIREGILDRKRALEIVHEENKPQYEALVWYFDRVGLDGHEVLRVVDRMNKRY